MDDEYDDIIAAALGKPAKKGKPVDYRKLYEEVGTKYGVDPDLLYRQAEAESNFKTNAKSPKGAAGPAQFMASTAREYGLQVGKGRDDRYNPRLAADAQARMMRDLLKRHKGDERLALAGYNAGHNMTSEEAARAADRFPETRAYVAKIQKGRKGGGYSDIVAAALEGDDATSSEYADVIDAALPKQRQPLSKTATGRARGSSDTVGTPPGGPANWAAYDRAAARATSTGQIRDIAGLPESGSSIDVVTPVRQLGTAQRNLATRQLSPAEARRRDEDTTALMKSTAAEVASDRELNPPTNIYGAAPPASPLDAHNETLRRVAEKTRRHGSALEALNADSAAASAETARQERIAAMPLVERNLARAAEFATGGPRGLVGAAGTTLKGIAAYNQVLPLGITALPGMVLGTSGTEDDPYYLLGKEITDASRAGLLNPHPDFETEFIAGQAPETVGQVALFALGAWAAATPRLAVAVLGATMTAGDSYDEVRQAGGSQDDALFAALVAGTLLGPTELIGLRGALKALSGTAREATIRAALHRAYIEGRRDMVENALQEAGQEYGQGLITGQHRTLEDTIRAAGLGAIGGTVTAPLTLISATPSPRAAVEQWLKAPEPHRATGTLIPAETEARLANLTPEVATPAQQTPQAPIPTSAPVTDTPAIRQGRGGLEGGQGVYATTSAQAARDYSRGQTPLEATITGNPPTHEGEVLEVSVPADAKIFEQLGHTDDSDLGPVYTDIHERMRTASPQYAREWDDNFIDTAQPTGTNIWDNAQDTGSLSTLQRILREEGFVGTVHRTIGNERDYSIWDSSIMQPGHSEGAINLYRGQAKLATASQPASPPTSPATAPQAQSTVAPPLTPERTAARALEDAALRAEQLAEAQATDLRGVVQAPTDLTPERMAARAAEDVELEADERRRSGETGPRAQVYTPEQRTAALEALGAPPIELRQIPVRSFADMMSERSAEPTVETSAPTVTTPVTEALTPAAREAAAEFHDLINTSNADILSNYGFSQEEDPEALRDNQLENKLEAFARATGMPYNTDEDARAVNKRVLDMRPEEYAPVAEPTVIKKARARVSKAKKFKAEGGKEFGSGGPDTAALIDELLVRGYDIYVETIKPTFDAWAKQMRKEFGDKVAPHLRNVWARVKFDQTRAEADRKEADREAARIARLEAFPVPPALMADVEKIVAARTRYGKRTETPTKSSYRAVWSNGQAAWYVAPYAYKPGVAVKLDANEILIPSNKKTAEAIVHRLSPLPLGRLAAERNPMLSGKPATIDEVSDFYTDLADTRRVSDLSPADEITDLGDVETPRIGPDVHDTARMLGTAQRFAEEQTQGTGPRTGPGNEYDRTVRALRTDFPNWTDAQVTAWIKRNRPDLREGGGIGDVQDLGDIDIREMADDAGRKVHTTSMQIDPRMVEITAKQLYGSKDVGELLPRELIQNAKDAVQALLESNTITDGVIHLNWDRSTRTLTIMDNGIGMPPEVVAREFIDVAGSLKQAMESTGSFGIGKGVGFYHADRVTVESIAKSPSGGRVKSTASFSSKDWIGQKPIEIVEESTQDSTGTTISITLSDATSMSSMGDSIEKVIKSSVLPGIEITAEVPNWSGGVTKFGTSDTPSPPKVRTIDISPETHVDIYADGRQITTQYGYFDLLSNGLYQNTDYAGLGDRASVPERILVDVRSTLRPDSTDYPWELSRNKPKDNIAKAITDAIKLMSTAEARQKNKDFETALADAPTIGGAPTQIIDPSFKHPIVAGEIAASSQMAKLNTAFTSLFENLQSAIIKWMDVRGEDATYYTEARFGGYQISEKSLGVTHASKTIFVSIFSHIDNVQTRGGLSTDEQVIDYINDVTATLVHELTHPATRFETVSGGHGESFGGELTHNLARMLGQNIYKIIKNSGLEAALTENNHEGLTYLSDTSTRLHAERSGSLSSLAVAQLGTAQDAQPSGQAGATPGVQGGGGQPSTGASPGQATTPTGKISARNPKHMADQRHHSADQPRDDIGRFATEREAITSYGRKLTRDYNALHSHAARRDGLSVVNEDVASNYFAQLRRFLSTHKPDAPATIDRAEQLYAQGRFADATLITEQALSGTHDLPSKLTGALGLISAEEKGLIAPGYSVGGDPKANWRAIYREVRRRMGLTGPAFTGGSVIYDVNKYPEGGRADHEKLALWLEPIIEGLRLEMQQAGIAAADRLQYIRTRVIEELRNPLFADWHPLNRSAVLGVVAGALRDDVAGTPPGEPPVADATESDDPTRPRSLPGTLERSGRDPGTDPRYVPLTRATARARIADRIQAEGAEAVADWLETNPTGAFEEDALRTTAFVMVNDALQIESVRVQSTDPDRAAALRLRARAATNRELARSTGMGQAIQAYTDLRRYEPADALLEAQRLADAAGIQLTDEVHEQITVAAADYRRLQAEANRLRIRVMLLEAEQRGPGTGAGEGLGPGLGPGAGPGAGGTGTTPGTGTGTEGETAKRPPKKRRRKPLLPTPLDEAVEARDAAAKRAGEAKVRVARKLAALERQPGVVRHYRQAINFTRGMMVSAIATAARNFQSQLARFEVERLDDLVEHAMRTVVGIDSDFTTRNIFRNAVRIYDVDIDLGPLQREGAQREATEILAHHPDLLAAMYNSYSSDVEGFTGRLNRIAEVANFANRAQEFHVRSIEFLAELDLHLRRDQGMSLEQFVRRNGIDQIPQSIVRFGVDKALEVTLAASPKQDTFGGRAASILVEAGNWIPPTISPIPFPRFMYNNIKFLYQHNITGLFDWARIVSRNRRVDAEIARVRADESLTTRQRATRMQQLGTRRENAYRAMAKTLTGSAMMLLGLGLRESDYAKDKDGHRMKWYQLNVGGVTVDTRPFGPFSTYLLFGEMFRRTLHGERLLTSRELVEGIGVSTGPGGSAIALADKLYQNISDWRNGDDGALSKAVRLVRTEGGEWGRAILTPVRQFRDLIAAFDEQEGYTHDTSTRPFTGPVLESIPGASRAAGLPPARRVTTAKPIKQENPLLKALTGWRIETPKTFLEAQLTELNFTPSEIRTNTGQPQVDAIEKRLMGEAMDRLSTRLSANPRFKLMRPAARALELREMLKDVRKEVRERGEAQDPAAYRELREMKKPRREREAERERKQSLGVSRALQLGVPLPIPPMRAGEDDVAYRARLLQLSRRRATALDQVVQSRDFSSADKATQRKTLHQAALSS